MDRLSRAELENRVKLLERLLRITLRVIRREQDMDAQTERLIEQGLRDATLRK